MIINQGQLTDMSWLYDPAFISAACPVERHIRAFEYMMKARCGRKDLEYGTV